MRHHDPVRFPGKDPALAFSGGGAIEEGQAPLQWGIALAFDDPPQTGDDTLPGLPVAGEKVFGKMLAEICKDGCRCWPMKEDNFVHRGGPVEPDKVELIFPNRGCFSVERSFKTEIRALVDGALWPP